MSARPPCCYTYPDFSIILTRFKTEGYKLEGPQEILDILDIF